MRSLDYFVLRTCERLQLPEEDFHALPYREQMRLLAYSLVRMREEAEAMTGER